MSFSFIHAADLHLGSPFVGLRTEDPKLADLMTSASRDALEDLVTQAIDLKVAFLIIAGDVYDGDWKDTTIGLFFHRQMSRLERAGIPVFLVRGNHDAESVITKAVRPPKGVRTFDHNKVQSLELPDLKSRFTRTELLNPGGDDKSCCWVSRRSAGLVQHWRPTHLL